MPQPYYNRRKIQAINQENNLEDLTVKRILDVLKSRENEKQEKANEVIVKLGRN